MNAVIKDYHEEDKKVQPQSSKGAGFSNEHSPEFEEQQMRRAEIHPAVAGRSRELAHLAHEVRRLVTLTITTGAGPDVLNRAIDHLQQAADMLAREVPEEPLPRFLAGLSPAEADQAAKDGGTMHAAMPYDLVIGRYNPLALPVRIDFEPPLAVATATYTTSYEGAPGCVHGAALASAFDLVLTAANQLAGVAGPTVQLALRFRRPTLIGVECRFEGEVTSNDGRRIHSVGRLIQDGVVTVEATGEFAVLGIDRVVKMRESRKVS